MKRIFTIGLISIFVLGLFASCSSTNKDANGKNAEEETVTARSDEIRGTKINALLDEFSIDLDATTAPAGDITFINTNKGELEHEVVVIKSDIDHRALPVDENGQIDEEELDEGIIFIDELEGITKGAKRNLAVDLQPGKYVVFCNLPGHYAGGMSTNFTVN